MADSVPVVMEEKGKEREEKKEEDEGHCYGRTDQGEDILEDDGEEVEEVEQQEAGEDKPKKKKRGGRKKAKVDPRSKMEYLDEVCHQKTNNITQLKINCLISNCSPQLPPSEPFLSRCP